MIILTSDLLHPTSQVKITEIEVRAVSWSIEWGQKIRHPLSLEQLDNLGLMSRY
uniref:Uncharacterized protein n=1 Tax=Lepeophtheirus salmonis TaxID=72036 RepID=A0A0K2URF9_LEPSM